MVRLCVVAVATLLAAFATARQSGLKTYPPGGQGDGVAATPIPPLSRYMHHWTFDTVYTDSGQTANPLTWVPQVGTPTFPAALYDEGVLDTSTAGDLQITGTTSAIFDGAGKFTYTVWWRPTVAPGGSDFQLILRCWLSGSKNYIQIYNSATQSKFRVIMADSGSGNIEMWRALYTGTDWVFISLVYNGDGLSGTEAAVLYFGINGAALEVIPSTVFGSWNGTRATGTMDGQLGFYGDDFITDEFRVYQLALSQAEVDSIYQEGVALLP